MQIIFRHRTRRQSDLPCAPPPIRVRPTAGQLAAAHDPAAGLLLGTQLTGAGLDDAIRKQLLPTWGLNQKFVGTFLRVQDFETYYLVFEVRNPSGADFTIANACCGTTVSERR